MIIRNGSMNLICIKGFKTKEAIFINTSNNELIKASNCVWDENAWEANIQFHTTVHWGSGIYGGPVINHLKNLTK
jgi:hypothetical protein